MRKLLLSLILALTCGAAMGQAQLNMTLLGQLNPPSELNDVWGYVDGNGKEYGLVGIQSGGIGIVDLSIPANPTMIHTIPGVPSLWRDLKVYGDYAYIVNDDGGAGGNGLLIVDLSNLPASVTYKDTVIQGMTVAHNLWIEDNYAYIVGADNNQGINVLDLTNPWFPNQIGQYTQRYVHDIYVRNDTAYAGELQFGLTIIDFTVKNNPVVIANRQYPGNFTHNTWLNDAGNVCFTTDEVSAGKITAFEISDLQNIDLLDDIQSSLSPDQLSIPHNAHVLNDYIVTSYYRDGINIVDASRPHNLVEVGYYDTSPLQGDGFDGNWGAYPFFPSGICLASDMDNGLFVLGVNYQRACHLEGNITDQVTGFTINGADVEIQALNLLAGSDLNGDYATGTATAGTYNVTYSKFGYRDTTISTTLTNGQVVIQDVALIPVDRVDFTVQVVEFGSGIPIPSAEVLFDEVNGAAQLPYTTDGNGEINDPAFISASYNVLAGKWGYRTKSVSYTVNQANTSLVIELEKGYYDDFVLDFNWSVNATAVAGIWERGEPIGTFGQGTQYNPEFDVTGDLGDQCYMTGNGGGGVGTDDVDDGVTTLTSPVMDLSNYTEPVIRFKRWFANGGGFGGAPNDTLKVVINNGITSAVLTRITGMQNIWVQDTFLVSNFIAPTNNVTVQFICGDYGAGHVVEGAIDEFMVEDLSPTAIAGSLDGLLPFMNVYPNPAVGERVTVSYSFAGATSAPAFELRDIQGRLVYQQSLNRVSGSFELAVDLPQGVYIARLMDNGVAVRNFKLLK